MEARYQIQDKIGQGGAGSVYKAYDSTLDRTVAIKKIRGDWEDGELEEISGSQATPEALLREAQLISSLSHPNVLTIHDVGQDEDGPFIVMEYLTGDNLSDVVLKAPLPLADFVNVAEQSLEGLQAVHGLDMLHRDIKPANLMLVWNHAENYQVKLIDFGLAKVSQVPTMQTVDQGGALLGSIHFMSPEQFERAPLDVRTDLYALGCVLYYSLTQNYPFDGDTAVQVMASHMEGRKTDLRELRSDIPETLVTWLYKLIATKRDDRFTSAKEALAELRSITEGIATSLSTKIQPLEAKPESFDYPPTIAETVRMNPADEPTIRENLPEPSTTGKKMPLPAIVGAAVVMLLAGSLWLLKDTLFAAPAVTVPSLTEKVYSPTDISAIRKETGKEITIAGTVVRAGESKSGKTRYLNFSWPPGKTVPLAFSSKQSDVSLDQLKTYEGKTVQARGVVEIVYGQTYVKVPELAQVAEVK